MPGSGIRGYWRAKRMSGEYPKGFLLYMKKNAEGDQPFTLNKHVRERLDQWEIGMQTE